MDIDELLKRLDKGSGRISFDEKTVKDLIVTSREKHSELKKFKKELYITQSSIIKSIGKKLSSKGKHIPKIVSVDDDTSDLIDDTNIKVDEIENEVFEIFEDDYAIITNFFVNTDTRIALIFYNDYDIVSKIVFDAFNDSYEPGTYQLVRSSFGYALVPISSLENEPPILNDEFEKKISDDIDKFFSKEDFFRKNDLTYKRGILLYGPPGNGKTSCIKNILSNHKDKYGIIVNCAEDFGSDISSFFKKNLRNKNKIIIIEDLDGMSDYNRSALLNFIDGINSPEKMFIIATTNSISKIDEALVERPSRFDRAYKIGFPDEESRKKLLLKFFPDLKEEILDDAVRKSKDFSGAYFKELYILCNLYDMSIIEAIDNVKNNINIYKSNKDTNYLG